MNNKELGDILQECEAVKFGDFTLVSGKKSRYYVNVKKAVTKPQMLKLICGHIAHVIVDQDVKVDYIACVELGAIPIGVMISVWTWLPLLIIRKAQKDYGLKSRIVGDHEKAKTALLLEDVTATGGSVISAAQAMRDEGIIVKNVISVVDRDEGAEEALAKEGLILISLVRAKTLLEDYKATEVLRYGTKD